MNEETKKLPGGPLSHHAMKVTLSPTVQKALENLNQMAKVPRFAIPQLSSPDFRMPEIPRIPSPEEVNEYQSASILMRVISTEALQWKERLPQDYKPAILAILYGGMQIQVQTLAKVSFHGIRIDGTMTGAPCSLLAHQSTVQLLCYAEEVQADAERNPIGFVWDDIRIEV